MSFAVFFSLFAIGLGYLLFKRLYNHITLYSFIWGVELLVFHSDLIKYRDLSGNTLLLIYGSWILLILASGITKYIMPNENEVKKGPEYDIGVVRNVLLVMIVLGGIGTFQHWLVILGKFGSFKEVIINGIKIYQMRVDGELTEMVPYLTGFNTSGSFFGVYYAAKSKRFKLLGIIPILLVILNSIAIFGRANMINSAILWGTSYFLATKPIKIFSYSFIKKIATLLFIGVFIIKAFELIRANRGTIEHFEGQTREMQEIKQFGGFITPSIVLYVSSHIGVLDKYLFYKTEKNRPDNKPVGGNSFASFYRISSKIGFTDPIPKRRTFYNVPAQVNTGTYLRDLYSDFGLVGTLIGVILLGVVTTFVYVKYVSTNNIIYLFITSYVFLVVFFSFAILAIQQGTWVFSFLMTFIAMLFIEKFGKNKTQNSA